MRILFVHQNAPGQFRHLAPSLAARPGHEVVFLGEHMRARLPGVRSLTYKPPPPAAPQTHHYLRRAEAGIRRGQTVARACIGLKQRGFEPDLVVAHPGWGEATFLREVLPRAAILSYCEMFYRSEGQDTGYVPETELDLDGRCRIRAWNADLLTGLDVMDRGVSPTKWQRDQHPVPFHDRIAVIHDGIDTTEVSPDPGAVFRGLSAADEVLTFVARDLEPVRGFTLLMAALPELLRRRPALQVVICGADGVSYGRAPAGGGTWRERTLRQFPVDPARVRFVGKLGRAEYLALLRISSLHLYLSVPFVLSWSCVEALAAGCLILGSDVPPVREVVEDGVNGFLVDARDPVTLAERAASLLAERHQLGPIRAAARKTAVARFDLPQCLSQQARLIGELVR